MRIGIDARSLQEKNLTGVGEYTLQIIRQILAQGREHEIRLFVSGAKETPLPDLGLARHPRAVVKRLARPNKLISLTSSLLDRPKLDEYLGRLDVFFSPNFNFTSLSTNCPQVLTVHDLSFELFPEFFSLKRRLWHRAVGTLRQVLGANHIICDSRSTATDLIKVYGVSPEQITTIPLAVGKDFTNEVNQARIDTIAKKYNLSKKFILSVGTREPRKNLVSLLAAYHQYREKTGETVELVIVGARGWRQGSLERALRNHKYRKDIKVLGFVRPEVRRALYGAARVVVATSSYEGFGLPALEALRCGTALISADVASLPEVTGQAALLVDPERPAEICTALEQVLGDNVLNKCLIRKGLVQSTQFDWRQVGKKTLKVLNGVVANREWQLQYRGLAPREEIRASKL